MSTLALIQSVSSSVNLSGWEPLISMMIIPPLTSLLVHKDNPNNKLRAALGGLAAVALAVISVALNDTGFTWEQLSDTAVSSFVIQYGAYKAMWKHGNLNDHMLPGFGIRGQGAIAGPGHDQMAPAMMPQPESVRPLPPMRVDMPDDWTKDTRTPSIAEGSRIFDQATEVMPPVAAPPPPEPLIEETPRWGRSTDAPPPEDVPGDPIDFIGILQGLGGDQ